MHFDDFIAQQIAPQNVKTIDPSPMRDVDAQEAVRRVLRTLWSGVRQFAWGIDAFSRVSHGMDVPPDHGARSRPLRATRHARP